MHKKETHGRRRKSSKADQSTAPGAAKLLEKLNSMTVVAQINFAERCSTTRGQLRQIAYGNRPCSPEFAVDIDRETNSEIKMQELCPDVIDWDHIRRVMRRQNRVDDSTKNAVSESEGDTGKDQPPVDTEPDRKQDMDHMASA